MSLSTEKLLGLAQTKSNKINNLSQNKYSTAGTNPQDVNNLSADELQYNLGQAVGHQVFDREDGSKFQYALNPDGTYAHDAAGNWIEQDFNTDGFANNQRNLYIDDTVDGNYKLGLAASDTKPGITPFEARYRDNTTLGNPYTNDRPNLYDGTPGPKGVTPEDGALLDVTLPFDVATNLEYQTHSNNGQLANRAIGQGKFNKEQGAEFGTGKTEYTTPNAPLWNNQATQGNELLPDTLLPKKPFNNATRTTELPAGLPTEKSYGSNLVDAAQAGVGTFLAKTGDTAVDALLRAGKATTSEEAVNKVVKDFDAFDDKGDFVGLDKYKLQEEYGYDAKNVEEASNSIRKAYQDPSIGNVFNAVLDSVKAGPEVLATSAGDVLAGVAGPAGWAVYAGNFTNEILEERAEIKGGIDKLTATDRLIAVAGGVPAALINTLSKGNIGLLEMKQGVQEGIKKGAIAAVKSGIGRGVKSAIGEGVEEAAQEAITTVASKIGTAKQKELMTDGFWEDLAVSAGLGFGAGGAASIAGGAKDAITSDAVKEAATSVKETVAEKVSPKAETELEKKVEAEVKTKISKGDEYVSKIGKAATDGDFDGVQQSYEEATELAESTGDANLKNRLDAEFLKAVTTLSKLAEEATTVDSPETKSLGANKSDADKERLVMALVDALDSDEELSLESIAKLAGNIGLSEDKTKGAVEKGNEARKLAKTMSQVDDEVNDGPRGIKTYINQFMRADSLKDDGLKQKASDRLVSFMDRQSTKLKQYESAVSEAKVRLATEPNGKTKVEGQNFEINHSDVANALAGQSRRGGLAVIDRIKESVDVMSTFLSDNGVDLNNGGVVNVKPTEDTAPKQKVTQKTFDFFRKKLDETVGNGFDVEKAVDAVSNTVDGIKGISNPDKAFIKEDIRKYVDSKPKAPEAEVKDVEPKKSLDFKEVTDEVVNAKELEIDKAKTLEGAEELKFEKPTKKTLDFKEVKSEEPSIVIPDSKPKKEKKEKKPKSTKAPKAKKVKGQPVMTILEDNLKTAKLTEAELEDAIDILSSNVKTFSDTISQYEAELDKAVSRKRALNSKLRKERFELKTNKTKLNKAQAHLKNKDLVRNKAKLKSVIAKVKAVMVQIMGQVARFRDLIAKNEENIAVNKKALVKNEQAIDGIISSIVNFKEGRREVAARAKNDKKTLETVKDNIKEMKEELASDVLETTAKAKELFEVSGKGGVDLTALDDKNRVKVQKFAAKIAKAVNENLKTLPFETLNDKSEIYGRLFVEETTETVKTRAGTKNQKVLKLDQRVAEMMAIEALMYSAEKLNDLTYNDDTQIQKMLGFSDKTIIPREVRQAMTQIGRFHSLEAAGLGKRILKDIGVKQKGTAEAEAQAKLESTLGGMTFKAMEELGLVQYNSDSNFTVGKFKELKNMVADRNEDNITSIENDSDTIDAVGGDVDLPIPMITVSSDTARQAKDAYSEINDSITENLDVDSWVKTARTGKKEDTLHEVRGMENEVNIPKKQNDTLNAMENKEWVLYKDNIDVFKKEWDKYAHPEDASDEDIFESDKQNKLLQVFGWKNPENIHIDTRDGVEAKNRVVKDSLRRLFEFNDKMGDKDFYFNWFFSKSGRFFMDSTEVNPQTDKLHRFLMGHKDGVATVDNEETRNEFKLAVVQAFDGSKLLGNRGEDRADIVINGEVVSDLGAIDKQSMEASKTQFEAIRQAVAEHDGDILDLVAGTDHPAHALMAIKELEAYKENDSFKTKMSLETDAVTSGFILNLLTNPIMEMGKLKKWLAKGGVWLGGTKAESFGEYNGTRDANGDKVNLDSYETGADAVQKLVDPQLNNPKAIAVDGLVGGVSRKFMKAPFMTFIYGSSIDNIKFSIGRDIADATMQKLSDESTVMDTIAKLEAIGLKKEMKLISRGKGGKALSPKKIAKRFREISVESRERPKRDLARNIYNTVSTATQDLHGEAVKTYMNAEFKEIVGDKAAKKTGSKSLINKGFTELFSKFKEQYDARVNNDMSKDEKDKVLEAMAKEGLIPGIFTVNAKRSDMKQRTGIVKKSPVSKKNPVQIPFKKSRTLNPIVREMVEAPSSGAVLNIHWLDGGIIDSILSDDDALGIHDATLQVVGKAMKNSRGYSKATWDMTQGYSVIDELVSELERNGLTEGKVYSGLTALSSMIAENKALLADMRVDIEHMSMPGSKISVGGNNPAPDTTVKDAVTKVKAKEEVELSNDTEVKGVVAELATGTPIVVKPKKAKKGSEFSVKVGGKKIKFKSVPRDTSKPLAVTTSTGEIKLQEGLTTEEVVNYLTKTEAPKGSDLKEILDVKAEVSAKFAEKNGIDFIDMLNQLTNDEVKQFLLLHENRHLDQVNRRPGKTFNDRFKNFMVEYKKNPVKFELDANQAAFKVMSKETTKRKDGKIKDKIKGVDIDIMLAIPDEHC